jgi:hypothetical protein
MADKTTDNNQPILSTWQGNLNAGVYQDFPSLSQRLQEYWRMRWYDPTIRAVMNRMELTVASKPGSFTMGEQPTADTGGEKPQGLLSRLKNQLLQRHTDVVDNRPETQLANWVNEEFHRLTLGKSNLYRNLLSGAASGFVLAQKNWDTTDPSTWRLQSVVPIHPLTFVSMGGQAKPIEVDDNGALQAVNQFDESGQAHPLDVEQLVYWPLSAVYREDVYGHSWLEAARRPWWIATALERFWNIWCETGAGTDLIALVKKGRITDNAGNQTNATIADYVSTALNSRQPGTSLVFEADETGEADPFLRVLTNIVVNKDAGAAMQQAITYWQSEKYKALGYPVLLLEDPKHSSRAQVQVVLEDWLRYLMGLQREMGEIIREQIIAPMVLYNYGEQASADVMGLGAYHFPSLQQDDLEAVATTLANLAQTGAVQLTQADEDGIRDMFAEAGLASPEMAAASRELPPPPGGESKPASEPGSLSSREAGQRYAHLG